MKTIDHESNLQMKAPDKLTWLCSIPTMFFFILCTKSVGLLKVFVYTFCAWQGSHGLYAAFIFVIFCGHFRSICGESLATNALSFLLFPSINAKHKPGTPANTIFV